MANEGSNGYMEINEIPKFKIFDASTGIYLLSIYNSRNKTTGVTKLAIIN